MNKTMLIITSLMLLFSYQPKVLAQETPIKNYAYFSLEPDIVTNYLSANARNLGFVRISIELMLEDAEYLEAAEHHSPLLRAAAIELIGRQAEEKIKSLTGREDIRRLCLEKLKVLMLKETGSEAIKDVIFTKYLYHQS
jgi:flagellar FliL protein